MSTAPSKNNTKYRYLASINLGLTVISKYPGVLLGVSLLIYLAISKTYRKELKNIHWYIGSVVALLIFSPVFIWNWQHDFSGFLFQWHHGVAQRMRPTNPGIQISKVMLKASNNKEIDLRYFG